MGTSYVGASEPVDNAQTFSENRNIIDKLTEMLISPFYFAKAASVIHVFWFSKTVMRKFGL